MDMQVNARGAGAGMEMEMEMDGDVGGRRKERVLTASTASKIPGSVRGE